VGWVDFWVGLQVQAGLGGFGERSGDLMLRG
jgi:hypothetical protein